MLPAFRASDGVEEGWLVPTRMGLLRRIFDMVCATIGLVVLSPLLLVIAVAVKMYDGAPVLFVQERVGKDLQPFRLYKFRSMVNGAERHGFLSAPLDSRLTRTGKWLRRYKLDELPQLLNVLRGEMQLVGARPEVPKYVQMFRREYAQILRDRPGITDPASLAYRHEEQLFSAATMEQQYVDEILPAKLKLAMDYQERRSFWSDLGVLLRTVSALFE